MVERSCSIEGCKRPLKSRGLCQTHYMRLRRQGDPRINKRERYGTVSCAVDGCEQPHHARGFCQEHYNRLSAYGDPNAPRRNRKVGLGGASHLEKNRFHKYGIRPEEFIALLVAQREQCAICGTDEPGGPSGKEFCVDHDHATGAVRGLLCFSCNVALGHLGDDPARLRAAAAYLDGRLI